MEQSSEECFHIEVQKPERLHISWSTNKNPELFFGFSLKNGAHLN